MITKSNEQFGIIFSNVLEILPKIHAFAEEIEAGRRLPPALVEILRQTGVFSMTMPKSLGGAELDPVSQIKIIEAISKVNAAVGWCVMIGSDSGYFAGFLQPEVAQRVYSDPNTITAAALSQTGKAVKVPGGYRVSGRWPFASGCQHSQWLVAGCKVYDSDEQMSRIEGNIPRTVQCFFHADDIKILDTWHSLGLRGSGSHDFTAEDIFIPEERTFSFQQPQAFQTGPLYQFPLAFMFNFAAVPLGLAQHAIEQLIEAADKPNRQVIQAGQFLEGKTLKDEAFVQDALGRASTKLRALRAFVYTEVETVWQAITSQTPLTPEQQTGFLAMNTEVFAGCQEVVELMVKARGGSAVYQGAALEQALRDIITINQHVMTSLRNYSQAGRVLLGVAPEMILL
jgi:indole-3-acetate monooxygenase